MAVWACVGGIFTAVDTEGDETTAPGTHEETDQQTDYPRTHTSSKNNQTKFDEQFPFFYI